MKLRKHKEAWSCRTEDESRGGEEERRRREEKVNVGRWLGVQGHREQPVLPNVQFKANEGFGAGGQMISFTEIPFIDGPLLLVIKLVSLVAMR